MTIELRVHGVGGTPPHDLLGEAAPTDIVRVGGDGKSAFYARVRDRSRQKGGRAVEGYAWGLLTSSGLLQPLWILLLPFTLLNVAGWMLPARGRAPGRGLLWSLSRVLVFLLGLTLTADYVFGLSVILTRVVFYENLFPASSGQQAVLAGAAAIAALGGVVMLTARTTQKRYERVEDQYVPEAPTGPRTAVRQGVSRLVSADDARLDDPGLWASGRAGASYLWAHAIVAAAGLAILTIGALGPAGAGVREPLGWQGPFQVFGKFQLGLLLLLFLICLPLFVSPWRDFVRRYFRFLGPVVVITVAIAMASGMLGGLSALVARILGQDAPQLELDLTFALGSTALAIILGALMLLLHLLARGSREAKSILERREPPVNSAPAGEEPNGLPKGTVASLGMAQGFSEFGRNLDLILTFGAATWAVVAAVSIFGSDPSTSTVAPWAVGLVATILLLGPIALGRPSLSGGTGGKALLAVPALLSLGWLGVAFRGGEPIALSTFANLGRWLLAVGATAFLGFWVRGYFNPGARRLVAILWDVLTFFPRRFHPLAVRPYAERAVPELVDRLEFHLPRERVILSAHSQGTVIALSALARLRYLDAMEYPPGERLKKVALVTYGAPLTQLHGRLFPAYFSPEYMGELAGFLFPGLVARGGANVPAGWRNFYRLTDYIGKEVWIGTAPGGRRNEMVPDPAQGPLITPVLRDEVVGGPPDPPLTVWVGLSRHSFYNSDPALQSWIRSLKELLD